MTALEYVERSSPHAFGDKISKVNLVNLLNRRMSDRLAIVRLPADSNITDHELYATTRVVWRERGSSVLPRMPRLLSIIESLRGANGVPYEIDLGSTEGVMVYIPTGKRLSDIPDDPTEAVSFLRGLLEDSVRDFLSTVDEVESYFWRAARQAGFSESIVERMARGEPGFDRADLVMQFERLLSRYFSVKFRVHRAEQKLVWEE